MRIWSPVCSERALRFVSLYLAIISLMRATNKPEEAGASRGAEAEVAVLPSKSELAMHVLAWHLARPMAMAKQTNVPAT